MRPPRLPVAGLLWQDLPGSHLLRFLAAQALQEVPWETLAHPTPLAGQLWAGWLSAGQEEPGTVPETSSSSLLEEPRSQNFLIK